jgi:hypothetical protein
MVRLEDVQGRVYTLKSKSACLASGMLTLVDPDIVRGHMVLVLDIVPEKRDHVKIMTVSVKWLDNQLLTLSDYVDFEERRRLCSYLPNTKEGLYNPTSTSKPPRTKSSRDCPIYHDTTKVFIPKDRLVLRGTRTNIG